MPTLNEVQIEHLISVRDTFRMILESIPALRQLTVEQKMRLSWELADEVSQSAGDDSKIMALLDARLDAYQANPAAVKTTEEVTAGILALKQRLAAS